jgi:pimeloyl-[acyl-carrier protein] methyl ester esterase
VNDSAHSHEVNFPAGLKLLLLPGFGGTGRLFQRVLQRVTPATSVSVFQYPPGVASLAELSDAAAQLCSDWPSTVLVSESMGSLVAVELCRRLPVMPRAAIFCAAFARSPKPLALDAGLLLPDSVLRWMTSNPLAIRLACMGQRDDELLSNLRQVTSAIPIAELRRRLGLIRRSDIRSHLATLAMPTLYLQASGDRLVPAHLSDEFCAAVPGIRRAVVRGPHLLLQSAPEECLRIIATFLGEADSLSAAAARTSSR